MTRLAKRNYNTEITIAELHRLLRCNPKTGQLWWQERAGNDRITNRFNTLFSGKEAGGVRKDGYRVVKINGLSYYTSDIVFVMTTGDWPKHRFE